MIDPREMYRVFATIKMNNANAHNAASGAIAGGWGLELLGSTAAGVSVSGRVLTPDGSGLRNAQVTMINAAGTSRTVTTSSFGFYTFDDVAAGGTFVIGVSSKRYRFESRFVQVGDSIAGLDFVAVAP